MSSFFRTSRSANLLRDLLMSEHLWVNNSSRNMLYQLSYLMLIERSIDANLIVYVDVIVFKWRMLHYIIFLRNSSVFGVFWPRRGLQANHGTVRKSAKSPQPGNQKQLTWSNTAYFNERSFNFNIKFCVFQVTEAKFCMKVIRPVNQ